MHFKMKNVLLTFLGLFLMVQFAAAQQVARQFVVIEEATGFW